MTKKYLITGGAGFIGTNYAARLLSRGERLAIYDNLSRKGATANIRWLRESYGANSFELLKADVRDAGSLESAAKDVDVIFHFAGQVAVTTSVQAPREDFETNALGTFNLLEAARLSGRQPIVVYASTNKVYGSMEDAKVLEGETRYRYESLPMGVPESSTLDFHSPYGCSKGTGDQYTRDYYRIYELPTVVFRQSCIYGPRQFGIEDQGWLAWFLIAALFDKHITIYGNGKQVRDVLFIDDLLEAFDAAVNHIDVSAGRVYNIGGGPQNTLSIWMEFRPLLENLLGKKVPFATGDWRPGDQPIFISDIRKAEHDLGWTPKVSVKQGIQRLYDWLDVSRELFLDW